MVIGIAYQLLPTYDSPKTCDESFVSKVTSVSPAAQYFIYISTVMEVIASYK